MKCYAYEINNIIALAKADDEVRYALVEAVLENFWDYLYLRVEEELFDK